jgi:ferredoxin
VKVWIDPDLCTGVALCEDIAPAVFRLLDDGIARVVQDGAVLDDEARATVPSALEDAVLEAAEACPAECIFLEAEG